MKNSRTHLVYLLLAACSFGSVSAVAQTKGDSKLTDPEIASVAVTANQIDIKYADLAKARSKNQNILKFAETMASDHASVIKQASDLVKKLHVTPKDNALSQTLNAGAAKTRKHLQTLSGAAFDKAYIDNEVAYHQAVIDAVKNKLVPESNNAELKELLQKVLPTLDTHLAHAKMVQGQLAK